MCYVRIPASVRSHGMHGMPMKGFVICMFGCRLACLPAPIGYLFLQ